MKILKGAFSHLAEWDKDYSIYHPFNEFWELTEDDYKLIEKFATEKYPTASSLRWFEKIDGFENAKNYSEGSIQQIFPNLVEECSFGRLGSKWHRPIGGKRETIRKEISSALKESGYEAVLAFNNLYRKFALTYVKYKDYQRAKGLFEESREEILEIDFEETEKLFNDQFIQEEEN